MSDAEIEEKFRSLASKYMDDGQIGRVIKLIQELETLDQVNVLMEELVFTR